MKKTDFKEGMDLWRTPERLVLVTCIDKHNKPQVITVSWNMRVSFDPPMFAISIHNSRHIHQCIVAEKGFVIAVPGADLAHAAIGCGESGHADEDRFEKYGLIIKNGDHGKSPLIENCIANFECILKEKVKVEDHTIFVGKAAGIWVNDKPSRNLLVTGDEDGYLVLAENGPYKIGIIK